MRERLGYVLPRVAGTDDFDRAVEAHHEALDRITKGDPGGFFELYSEREDVTLANPFGPPARGRAQVEEGGNRGAANYRDGHVVEFETFAKNVSGDLAYTLEIERFEAKVGGSDQLTPVALRVTTIFRREDGAWRIIHRHADPITSLRPAESVVQT